MITEEIYESIDYKKTKEEVIKLMGVYKMLLLRMAEQEKPRITSKYVLSFGGSPTTSGNNTSQIETYVVKKIMLEEKLYEWVDKVVGAINKLAEDERKYMYLKYLSDMRFSDAHIIPQCNIYDRGFKKLKKEAHINLAFILGIEIYKDEENEEESK